MYYVACIEFMYSMLGTAGITSWFVIYPFDVIKARLQADTTNSKYSSVSDCVYKTYQEGGVKAFTRGLGFTLIRAVPVASVILPIYETSKEALEVYLHQPVSESSYPSHAIWVDRDE